MKEILRKYEYDDDFIDNINDDIAIGYAVAIDIIKRMASKEIHKENNDFNNGFGENDYER